MGRRLICLCAQCWHRKQYHLSFLLKQWGCRQSRKWPVQVQLAQIQLGEEGRGLNKKDTSNFPEWGWVSSGGGHCKFSNSFTADSLETNVHLSASSIPIFKLSFVNNTTNSGGTIPFDVWWLVLRRMKCLSSLLSFLYWSEEQLQGLSLSTGALWLT